MVAAGPGRGGLEGGRLPVVRRGAGGLRVRLRRSRRLGAAGAPHAAHAGDARQGRSWEPGRSRARGSDFDAYPLFWRGGPRAGRCLLRCAYGLSLSRDLCLHEEGVVERAAMEWLSRGLVKSGLVLTTPSVSALLTTPCVCKKIDDLRPDPLGGPPRAAGTSMFAFLTSRCASLTNIHQNPNREQHAGLRLTDIWICVPLLILGVWPAIIMT